jgi:hypothetical protein
MPDLHPALLALEKQYDQLYQAAEDGHIRHEDALASLAGLSVTDDSGAVWGMGADGEFVRAAFLGSPAQHADPALFASRAAPTPAPFSVPQPQRAPTQTRSAPTPDLFTQPPVSAGPPQPTGAPAFGQPPFAGPVGHPSAANPFPPSLPGQPRPAQSLPAQPEPEHRGPQYSQHIPMSGHSDSASFPRNLVPPGHGGSSQAGPGTPHDADLAAKSKRAGRKLADADRPKQVNPVLASVKGVFGRNRALVAIVGVAIVLLGALAVLSGSSSSPSGTSTTLPLAASPAVSLSGASSTPTSATPVAVTGAAPTAADAQTVILALETGNAATIIAVAATAPTADALLAAQSEWRGAAALALIVQAGPAVLTGSPTQATQTWQISPPGARQATATVQVTWAVSGSQWKLAALPLFN